jgi:hypothetical protein
MHVPPPSELSEGYRRSLLRGSVDAGYATSLRQPLREPAHFMFNVPTGRSVERMLNATTVPARRPFTASEDPPHALGARGRSTSDDAHGETPFEEDDPQQQPDA